MSPERHRSGLQKDCINCFVNGQVGRVNPNALAPELISQDVVQVAPDLGDLLLTGTIPAQGDTPVGCQHDEVERSSSDHFTVVVEVRQANDHVIEDGNDAGCGKAVDEEGRISSS